MPCAGHVRCRNRSTKLSATAEVQSGLEGVVAFATEIAEPDKEGGSLRYRGIDIEELVGNIPFEEVWGLLVDGKLLPGLPPAEPHPLNVHSGDPRADVQSALAMLAPQWGFGELIDISDEEARDHL
ncbi:MAG TPA: citrate/2-methylcitrate synthase, partial [Solirubrobacteraceae bacterium]|nr:citrate/2-methylcitrate synthase [Solirubrobacteraceae bacterium]